MKSVVFTAEKEGEGVGLRRYDIGLMQRCPTSRIRAGAHPHWTAADLLSTRKEAGAFETRRPRSPASNDDLRAATSAAAFRASTRARSANRHACNPLERQRLTHAPRFCWLR